MPPPAAQPAVSEARAELETLQSQLASRRSIVHFAHTGVSTVAAFIFTGAAAKLFWDSIRFPVLGVVAAAIALTLGVYAWVNYRRGQRHLRRELALFASLLSVRRALQLDDPSALLPR